MKTISKVRIVVACLFAVAVHTLFAGYDAEGGYVTLLGHNSGSKGESTFMTNIVRSSYGWSDGRDPHSGTNYYCASNKQLCTPNVEGGSFKFPGDSLVIGMRLIALASSTLEIDDFRLESGAYVMTMGNAGYDVTLRGNMTILGGESNPSWLELGKSPQSYKVEAGLKGTSSSYAYLALNGTFQFESFDTQYVELDDADEYNGTFEVRTNTCLKLASDLPGTVAVANGGCLNPIEAVEIGTLSLADGAKLAFTDGGTATVSGAFSASGRIIVESLGGATYSKALLVVPASCGTLDASRVIGNGVKVSVVAENGVQTLYAEALEPSAFDETTGYVTQEKGGTSTTSTKNIFDEPSAWSDSRTPHSDTNYYGYGKGIYITTNSTFAGRSLTVERTMVRLTSGTTLTIPDLRVKGGNSATSSIFASGGSAGSYYLFGEMAVLSLLTESWPFAFFGGNDGQTWISSQTITGDDSRALELRGNIGKAPGTVSNYVEFLGDLSKYHGTIIVGTNFTARLGGSAMPGRIRLDTEYSHVDTKAADGVEIKIGALESLVSTSISVAETNALSVTDSLAITGTLAKNGEGLFAAGGTAVAGEDAALSIAAGSLRADSAYAFDGIQVSFADGATYVRDCSAEDEDLVQYGLYDTASVTASGTLNVELDNCAADEGNRDVALFTVPESYASALKSAISFVSSPKGFSVSADVVDASSGMKTIKAVLSYSGMVLIVR